MRAICCVMVLCVAAWCRAGECQPKVRHVVGLTHDVAVVPFAVPVAVPVAVVQRPVVIYGYGPPQKAAPERIAEPSADATAERSAVSRHCAACHTGDAPKAGFDLSGARVLDAAGRLEAIARVVSDDPQTRMPPGAALPPAEIGRLVQELSSGE